MVQTVLRYPEADSIVDGGCGQGTITCNYAKCMKKPQAVVAGTDIKVPTLRELKSNKEADKLSLFASDIYKLPLKNEMCDVLVCASILEHLIDLNPVMIELRRLLKTNGVMILSYPIETKLFKTALQIVAPSSYLYINQQQTMFLNPSDNKWADYWTHPFTHKQTYTQIRTFLEKNFTIIRRTKLPFNWLPDWLCFYEIVEAKNN
ncbi:MAG: class I SAM-dependent methyltransferase [Candidatus Bathyarchaeota archaeon]|nr:class I SAM-dependent methyltransferase [Candidatus Bathyarchaeota archaeon]